MVRGGSPEAMVNSPLHFARFEFKYVLRAKKRREVESDLLYFLEYDPFVENRDNHRYFVRSLYFDDPNFTAFHDKIDGLHSRSKFRLRTYAFDSKKRCRSFSKLRVDITIWSSNTEPQCSGKAPNGARYREKI